MTLIAAAIIAVAVEGQPGKFRYFDRGCEVYPRKSILTGEVLAWIKVFQHCEYGGE